MSSVTDRLSWYCVYVHMRLHVHNTHTYDLVHGSTYVCGV